MSLDANGIGARIRKLRVNKCLSQTALGEAIGTNPGLISIWEAGKRPPSLRSQKKLADFFNVSPEFIAGSGNSRDKRGYVLADYTCLLSPAGWGARVAEAANAFKADCVVAEANFGGAMVESVLRTAGVTQHVKMVTASRGEAVRAEPIAALYEQNRIGHAKAFAPLEDQLCAFTTEGYAGEGSPDRADALVWALTELLIAKPTDGEGWLEYAAEKMAEWRAKGLVK
jgi:transcriptional regulator with XRE-family HTH domain